MLGMLRLLTLDTNDLFQSVYYLDDVLVGSRNFVDYTAVLTGQRFINSSNVKA